ncbi:MAG: hypothetical protein SVU88_04935 [Candidatus Nanohaloarchaea archaeon]|nr:hypothetical protein [Candidatus Nanohaloarchaea archaeon]
MELCNDDLRYGVEELHPFAVWMLGGGILTASGPATVESLFAGVHGPALWRFTGALLAVGVQVAGAVLTTAGFFGALRRVLRDTR